MKPFIALLRGINVGGHAKVPMAQLREECEALGWAEVVTYVNSGNVVFRVKAGAGGTASLESALEARVAKRFGLEVPILVRSSEDWTKLAESNPFSAECVEHANLVHLCVAKGPLRKDVVADLRARSTGERIERVGEALWIYFANGAGRSKLTPASIDKAAGSRVTARNWRTVQKLREMTAQV